MNFKTTFFLFMLILGLLFSCEDEKMEFRDAAVITGPDLGQCICCGGYFIEIGDSTYNFEKLPEESSIDLTSDEYPIEVNIDWESDKKCGNNQYIEITRIERK